MFYSSHNVARVKLLGGSIIIEERGLWKKFYYGLKVVRYERKNTLLSITFLD